jgi:hypothetical protein
MLRKTPLPEKLANFGNGFVKKLRPQNILQQLACIKTILFNAILPARLYFFVNKFGTLRENFITI